MEEEGGGGKMKTMKTKYAWLGVGLWMLAATAWGAEGLWLGQDDRVAVVAKSAGTEWAEAAGVLLECAELDIPLAVFHGALTEEERAAETEAIPPEGEGMVEETGAGFEALGERLADFDPSHVILTGWKPGEGIPRGVAEALEETPAMILQSVGSKGDYTMSLADFQKEVRNMMLPSFGLAPSKRGVEHFRRTTADDLAEAAEEEAVEAEGKPAPSAPESAVAFPGTEEVWGAAEPVGGGTEARGAAKLKPRTKLPDAPKPKAWFDMPAGW